MIEDRFRKWINLQLDGVYDYSDLNYALTDDDYAEDMWEGFSVYHRQELIELVRQQIRGILKKQQQHP